MRFTLPDASQPALTISDLPERPVQQWPQARPGAGAHESSPDGQRPAPGGYLRRLQTIAGSAGQRLAKLN